jgi:hypothetical protein
MRSEYGSVVGGIVGGLAISVAMEAVRRNGWLHKTLAEDAEDWLIARSRRGLTSVRVER